MLENILGTLKSETGSRIINETKLPSDQLDNVFSVIGNVTKKEVSQQMTGGGIGNVMNLFSKKPNDQGASQVQSNIHNGVIQELTGKLGLSQQMSGQIAQLAIPALINMITHKNSSTPDDDPSPLHDIFGGAAAGSVGGAAKNILGKFMK